jgi:uncharacterized protein YbdZ (MbtH family)
MSAKKLVNETEFVLDESEAITADAADAGQAGETQATGKQATAARNSKPGQPFDPTQYLSNFDGRDYLEVKWRLLWLRSQHPDARISTEIVQHNEEGGFALFRAEVDVPDGGKATGWGSETVRDFHDYIEAAETKAIGRALAALGFGTQFCTDFDFSANARPGRAQVVDAPVNLAEPRNVVNRASAFLKGNTNGNGSGGQQKEGAFTSGGFNNRPAVQSVPTSSRLPAEEDDFDRLPQASASPNGSGATEKQIKAIYAIGRTNKRLTESQVDDRCAEVFGVAPAELTKAEASQFIDILKGEAAA